jgi:diguanylate cyclase (GGDEF)-like protein
MDASNPSKIILVVDDTQLNIILLDRLLKNEGYQVLQAERGNIALDIARKNYLDMVLLDINMPGMDGYEVCRQLKADEKLKDIPVIFISALSDTMDKVMALSVGGVDYITKPFQAEEVLARIETHLKISNLQKELELKNTKLQDEITRREEAEKELTILAATDPLTKVFNRRHFFEFATRELSRANRTNVSFSIIMADIDHFKNVNDNYGHLIGDQVLIRFTKICQENLRHYDVLARYGGEEFVILLPETGIREAVEIAERLRSKIETAVMKFGGHEVSITTSLGIASTADEGELTLEVILDRADQVLYQAKQNGRNKFFVWQPE